MGEKNNWFLKTEIWQKKRGDSSLCGCRALQCGWSVSNVSILVAPIPCRSFQTNHWPGDRHTACQPLHLITFFCVFFSLMCSMYTFFFLSIIFSLLSFSIHWNEHYRFKAINFWKEKKKLNFYDSIMHCTLEQQTWLRSQRSNNLSLVFESFLAFKLFEMKANSA